GAVVAEVGVAEGYNAKTILEGAKPSTLHVIDLDLTRYREVGLFDHAPEVTAHEGQSAEVLSQFPDSHFDWIYIDGDHQYGGVSADIQQAKRVLKPDGVVVFNDYTTYSPQELLSYGVVRAVNELCLEGWMFRYIALEPLGYWDVALIHD